MLKCNQQIVSKELSNNQMRNQRQEIVSEKKTAQEGLEHLKPQPSNNIRSFQN